MSDITQILLDIEDGDPNAAERLLPLVYDSLRQLASARLANEKPGQTLQATALVHEAFIRLVDQQVAQNWNERGHFFAAAAEAMRRILVERARSKATRKRGGELLRVAIELDDVVKDDHDDRILELDQALSRLEGIDEVKAQVVKLRFFGGMTNVETAKALGVSVSTVDRHWAYARAWLKREIARVEPDG